MESRPLVVAVLLVARVSLAQQLGTPLVLNEPELGPAGGNQRSPSVTWTGSSFFVVWSDDRDARTIDLWFRTFDAKGQPLDPRAAPLLRAPRQQASPSAMSGGGSVLVAWLDDTVCASEVMAQRFTPTGQSAGAVLRLSTGACMGERPSIAWDAGSSQWLVVWGSHGAGREVHGAIIAADGTLAVSDFVIATGPNNATSPMVLTSPMGGAPFLVTWSDDRLLAGTPAVFAAPVLAAGVVGVASQVRVSAVAQRSACGASFGPGALIIWLEGNEVRAQMVTNTGTPSGNAMVVTTGPLSEVSCASGAGGSVLVASTDSRGTGPGVYLRAVEADGGVSAELDAAPRVGYFSRDAPRLAVTGTDALLVARGPWGFTTDDDVVGRAVSLSSGLTVDAGLLLLGNGGTHVSKVSAAFDGTNYLSVWRSEAQGTAGGDSFGQLIAAGTGQRLLDGGVRISTNSANLVSYPTVGGADAGFFVSWGDEGSSGLLVGKRVSSQGVASAQLRLSDVSSYVNTSNSRWFLDGWATTFLKNNTLRVRRTSPAGALVQAETVLVPTGGAVEQLDSDALGDVMLSVFLARDAGLDVWGARIEADAGLLDPLGFAITNLPGDELDPAVAAGRTFFLVAWSRGGDVFATRVTKEGVLLDVPPLLVGGGPAIDLAPAVGWTGRNFVVAWQRDGDVVAARVGEDGELRDATAIVIAATAEVDRAPRVARGPLGEALITWEAFDESRGSFEALGRFITETVDPDAGTSDAGIADAGQSDAGSADAGMTDAGVVDAGVTDAGEGDAGPRMDPGVVDSGTPDSGMEALPHRSYGVGCGCAGIGELGVVLAMLLVRRRRQP
ncbi:MAG: hypothetical protein Q8N23_04305 [Archangium sp.]|nr:hypothetical protein [Archangium sp.]MDP3151864.1 hypothetical protein [Archangium sp.]MDP3574391.1 hypothetical protein [Archangium sp.]